MGPNTRLFLILWLAGMAGVLSFLLVDISALIAAMPLPEGTPPPELPPPALLKLVSIVQPAVLTSIAVVIGIWLAPKVGLHAPAAEAFANRQAFLPALIPQIVPGVIAGLASGVALVATWVILKPFMPEEFVARAQEFNKFIPHAVRMLYGGLTEELLLRWGVMTFLVWIFSRIFQRAVSADEVLGGDRLLSSPPAGGGVAAASADAVVGGDRVLRPQPRRVFFFVAILLSALVFGAGHLPVASILSGGLTIPVVIYVITGNSLFGIVAGFLYWRRGLESAMIAHMFAHVVLITAIYLAF